MQAIGDRMKANYEARARHGLLRRVPVIVRVDGKAFHSYAYGFRKPFDGDLMLSMEAAAKVVMSQMQGCKAAYIQSDEASFLLTDYDCLTTEAWFDYDQQKLASVAASVMAVEFNDCIARLREIYRRAYFDGRAFNVPREEVVNYFLWRAKDWERNSVAMYCRAHFSHREMHGQGMADQHELLHSLGLNWATDLSPRERNGAWLFSDDSRRSDLLPNYADIAAVLEPLVYCDRVEQMHD